MFACSYKSSIICSLVSWGKKKCNHCHVLIAKEFNFTLEIIITELNFDKTRLTWSHGNVLPLVPLPPAHTLYLPVCVCIELEEESPVINWSLELGTRLDSRLYALWNRTAGDCLLDSVLQATWGIYDKDSVLRKTLHDSLHDCSHWYDTHPYAPVPIVTKIQASM